MEKFYVYKDSGVKWLGNIPQHWEVRKIKYVFTERSQKGFPKEPILCSTQKYGVIPQHMYENRVVVVNKGLEGLKLVRKGDFVISLRSFQGGIEYAYYQGIISAAYTILNLNDNCYSNYIKYLMKSFDFIQLLQTCVTGIREGQNINYTLLRKSSLPLPPLAEQRAIVSYLDGKVGQIDTYVAKQTQQIELLKELKQAVIANAVTKGIDNKAKLKQTGISWIGHVPQHWERCRCKDVLTEIKLLVGNGEYALLSLTTNGVIVRDLSEGKGKFPKDFNTYKVVKPNDLVFCLFDVDETPRTVGLVHNHGMLTGAYNVFETKNVDTSFLYHYFIALDNRKALKPLYKGLRKVIPLPAFMSMPLYIPPLSEQRAIVSYIEAKTASINKLIDAYEQQVERVKEYKQRLISDAVTGKMNVTDEHTQTN
ncbi:restriction endonuclease subunit S [Prevotella sp. oral taxon 317]|uniref:restriction endonuclease subunit S n=1 Tax=Prevotella sp. oral taxon 317 TaxID=652721 RepID=UPI0012FB33C4|nr:restriction endonuclease subunit S [Prevotella sp. oral taxon 317]